MNNNQSISEEKSQIDETFKRDLAFVAKRSTYKSYFIQGIFRGLGSVVGVTILIGILLPLTLSIIDNVPILEKILEFLNLDTYIRQIIEEIMASGV